MFHKIETVEIYFPAGNRSFYKVGMAIQTPTPKQNVYAKTDMIVTAITTWRLFKMVTIHLSNGEKIKYGGVQFAISMGGFSNELENAVERKMKREEELERAMKPASAPTSETDTPSEPTATAEPAGESAPPVGELEKEKI